MRAINALPIIGLSAPYAPMQAASKRTPATSASPGGTSCSPVTRPIRAGSSEARTRTRNRIAPLPLTYAPSRSLEEYPPALAVVALRLDLQGGGRIRPTCLVLRLQDPYGPCHTSLPVWPMRLSRGLSLGSTTISARSVPPLPERTRRTRPSASRPSAARSFFVLSTRPRAG